MIWQEIVFEEKLTRRELEEGLSKVFRVETAQINITHNIEAYISEEITILCQSYFCSIDYPIRITVYLRETELIPSDDIAVLTELSVFLNRTILISSDGLNPHTMQRVNGKKNVELINVNLDIFDNCIELQM